MAKGFTDSKGKFRPTGNNGKKSSREKTIETSGMEMDGSRTMNLKFTVWKFDNAPEEVKEKIIEKLRKDRFEFSDTFFAEDQGLIFDDDEKKDATDIGLNMPFPKFFDVGSNRGTDFVQFRDLQIEDENKFAEYLGINKELQKRVSFEIENDENRDMDNTTLEIVPPDGIGRIDERNISNNSALDDLWKYNNPEINPEDRLTEKELDTLIDAVNKFDKLMSMTLKHLTNNYEDQFTDETLAEDARANDYDFDEDGMIV